MGETPIRWRLADDQPQSSLFPDDELVERHVGTGEFRGMEFLHVNARRVVNQVAAASRMPFRWTINAYRGCSHACTYCYARSTHEYLGLNLGEDFDRKIVVKVNAVERVRAELASKRWTGEHIAMGTNTDPYQRCEGKYHLTRGIVQVLSDARNPFSILTKSTLILRDLELLVEAAQRTEVRTSFSIGTLDERVWKETEPGTPHPRQRIEAVRKLNEAGVPCGVLVSPILPGISDSEAQIADVVDACVEAGAVSISGMVLHLRTGVKEHFLTWLAATRPELVDDYAERYAKAYLPAAEGNAISGAIRAQVKVARARRGATMADRPPSWRRSVAEITTGTTDAAAAAAGRAGGSAPSSDTEPAPEQLGFAI